MPDPCRVKPWWLQHVLLQCASLSRTIFHFSCTFSYSKYLDNMKPKLIQTNYPLHWRFWLSNFHATPSGTIITGITFKENIPAYSMDSTHENLAESSLHNSTIGSLLWFPPTTSSLYVRVFFFSPLTTQINGVPNLTGFSFILAFRWNRNVSSTSRSLYAGLGSTRFFTSTVTASVGKSRSVCSLFTKYQMFIFSTYVRKSTLSVLLKLK